MGAGCKKSIELTTVLEIRQKNRYSGGVSLVTGGARAAGRRARTSDSPAGAYAPNQPGRAGAGASNTMVALTLEQKRTLFRDGFLRLKQVVPQELVREARRQININRSGGDNMESAQAAVAAMFNESDVKPLLESGLGSEVPLQKGGQMAVLNPSPSTDKISEAGYPLNQIPFHQWQGHLDGLWNGSTGALQSPDEDDTEWFGPKGSNGVDFCLDADSTYEERSSGVINGSLTISGFSCLVVT